VNIKLLNNVYRLKRKRGRAGQEKTRVSGQARGRHEKLGSGGERDSGGGGTERRQRGASRRGRKRGWEERTRVEGRRNEAFGGAERWKVRGSPQGGGSGGEKGRREGADRAGSERRSISGGEKRRTRDRRKRGARKQLGICIPKGEEEEYTATLRNQREDGGRRLEERCCFWIRRSLI